MWRSNRNCWIHLGKYLMHAWLDFVTKLQKYTSSANIWSTSEECKNLYAVVYQTEEYKYSSFVVILHCLNIFKPNNYVAFSLLYAFLRGNYKINAVGFPSFRNGCNPACKVWRRLRAGELLVLSLITPANCSFVFQTSRALSTIFQWSNDFNKHSKIKY